MKNQVHVVLAADANYASGLRVTQGSMIRSCSDSERVIFHVFDESALKDLAGLEVFDKYNTSKMPYLRLFLPELLPEVEWVVYSDVDTIWNRDVCELELLFDRTVSIQWVRDFRGTMEEERLWGSSVRAKGLGVPKFDEKRYACSGICIMNLKKMREEGMTRKAVAMVAACEKPPHADQDVLNELFNQDSSFLSSVWNCMGHFRDLPRWDERCVYHLTGVGLRFHAKVPPVYPPQYQFWWNIAHGKHDVCCRSRMLAALWPFHFLSCLVPWHLRERVVRQWFFAKVLADYDLGWLL